MEQVVDAVQSVKMTNARGEVKYPIKVCHHFGHFHVYATRFCDENNLWPLQSYGTWSYIWATDVGFIE